MSDALWAAREGDALMHTSMMADIIGGVLEVAANVAIGALATAAVAAALGLTVATGGLGCFVLGAVVGVVVGVVMAKTGADTGLSRLCEGIGNSLFPPTVQATIASGSPDTRTNGMRAARAAGVVLGPMSPLEGGAGGEAGEEQEETFLDMAKGFFSQMWRPTVTSPAPNTLPAIDDKVICSKHPPMPPQYLAEGSSKVLINGQPACRSGDRSTCEAVIVDGGLVSNNVRIGGEPIVVREVRSGKTPGIGLAITALMLLRGRGGKFYSKFGCMLIGGATSFVTGQATGALTRAIVASSNPVHASTGAKILGGEDDRDFSLQAVMPVEWQRYYNSRDERREGLFGAGWSVPFEVSIAIEPARHGERFLFTDEQARVVDMGYLGKGDAVFSASEGLSVRRSHHGEILIEDIQTGLFRLFEPSPGNPAHLRLLKMGDRNDNRIYLDYDDLGRLVELRDTFADVRLSLTYDTRWQRRVAGIERIHADASSDYLVRYHYDDHGDLCTVHDGDGRLLRRFAYDPERRMIEHQLTSGLVCHYDWAPSADGSRVARHWTSNGDEYHYAYDLDERVTRVTDGMGRTSVRQWNEQYQITAYTDEVGNTWHFDWNDDRQLLRAVHPGGGLWQFFYDASGNLTETLDPLGRSETTQWLEHWALPKSRTDREGHQWYYHYDRRGNCILQRNPLGCTTHYHYDDRGLVTCIVDAAGKRRQLNWTPLGLLREHTDCSGYRTRFRYDRNGYLETITNALGDATHYHHDLYGRLLGKTLPDGLHETYQLNAQGLTERYIDTAGQATGWRYDLNGRIVERVDQCGRSVRMDYDPYGRLTSLTNENGERYLMRWDHRDRLIEQHYLDGSIKAYRYGPLDEVTQATLQPAPSDSASPAIVHDFLSDQAGRLIGKRTRDGLTRYAYDPSDRLTEASFIRTDGGKETVAFSFDALGQLRQERSCAGTLEHQYDELGNRLSTTLPDGRTINRLYYGSGYLHQINIDGRVISDFERDRLHREVLRTQGGLATRSEFDRCGRPRVKRTYATTSPAPLPAPYQSRLDFGPANHLTAVFTQRPEHIEQQIHQYDASGRILASQGSTAAHSESLAYDPSANLIDTQSRSLGLVRHNQLLTYQDKRYRYDGFGRLIEKKSRQRGTQHLSYDAEHRLVEVRSEQAGREVITRMSYDPLGRRTAKTVHTQAGLLDHTQFNWDGLHLLQEKRNGRLALYLYVDQSHEPLARVEGAAAFQEVRYYHTQPNGLPTRVTASDGETLWQAQYRIWGSTCHEERSPNPLDEQNLRYQGQYLDRETGFHYNTFRFYDPDIGRFTQPDPLGLQGGINLYQYAPNPITWIDPWGLEAIYENPGHHDPSYLATRQVPFNSSKSILPDTHEALFKQSVSDPDDPKTRWTKVGDGKKAVWHRFQSSAPDGSKPFHWNGSTDGKDINGRPRAIDRKNVPKFAQKMKGCAL